MKKSILDYIKIITLVFMFIYPLSGIFFFHNHITNLVIVIVILLLFLVTIIFNKNARKKSCWIFLYYILCLIYLFIEYIRSKYFVTLVPNDFNIIKEGLTIIKICMPITFLYTLINQHITKKEYIFIIKSWIILIAGLIIITNIFKIGFSSYGDNLIRYNIFEWNKNLYYVDTACKGLFMYANQVSLILLLLLVITNYLFVEDKKSILYITLIVIAMIMLGTRISSLGGLIVLISLTIFYFVYSIFKKRKVNKHYYIIFIPIICWILILPISPYMNRNNELSNYQINNTISADYENVSIDTEEIFYINSEEKYFLEHYNPNYIPNYFFKEYYPIKYDPELWYNLQINSENKIINYRYIEKEIIKRVVAVDNKQSNILFGISNIRIQNIVNIESDSYLYYYAFGIIGSVLFLLVYIGILTYLLHNTFNNQSYYLYIILTITLLYLFVSHLTGNILNSLFPSISYIFIINRLNIDE